MIMENNPLLPPENTPVLLPVPAGQELPAENTPTLRELHRIEILTDECDECFDRFVIREEPRPADGYICDLNDYSGCSCGGELVLDEFLDRECADYLMAKDILAG